jgi:hypothetical protein
MKIMMKLYIIMIFITISVATHHINNKNTIIINQKDLDEFKKSIYFKEKGEKLGKIIGNNIGIIAGSKLKGFTGGIAGAYTSEYLGDIGSKLGSIIGHELDEIEVTEFLNKIHKHHHNDMMNDLKNFGSHKYGIEKAFRNMNNFDILY